MPQFRFRALAPDGRRVRGRLEAADGELAVARLRERGLLPVELRAREPLGERLAGLLPRRRSDGHAVLLRELATLLAAGERLDAALAVVAEEAEDRRTARALRQLRERVRAGHGFARALAETPELADRELVAVVTVGETAGRLAGVLDDLARSRSRRAELARRLRGALVYPVILAAASLFAVLFVLTGVVPRFESLVAGREAALPAFARAVFALSRLLREGGDLLAAGLLLALLAGLPLARLETVRARLDGLALALPGISGRARERIAAEFTRALAVLGGSGVELPRAVALSAEAVSNRAAREILLRAAVGLRQGRTLAAVLAETGLLPRTALGLLRVGEESGRIGEMAAFLAGHYETRLTTRAEQLVRVVEPVLVVLLGLVVAGIVGAVMTALLTLQRFAV